NDVTFSNGSALELGGDINLGGGARTILNNNTGGTILSGSISNDGGNGLTFDTSAQAATHLTLANMNTFSGAATVVGNGTVAFTTLSSFGTSGELNIGLIGSGRAPTLRYTGAGETSDI